MRNSLRLVVGGLCLAAVLAGAGTSSVRASAPGSSLGCGQTITKDTVLRQDLVDCQGPGLVIGADGVTLDLGGHTVSGALTTVTLVFQCELVPAGYFECTPCDAPGFAPCGPPFATPEGFLDSVTLTRGPQLPAIDNTGGFDRVTVRNGQVKDFEYGARLIGADRFQVTELQGLDSSSVDDLLECVVCAEDSRRGHISLITALGQGSAVDLRSTSDTIVEDAGIVGAGASDRNTFRRVQSVGLFGGSDRNVVEQSRFGCCVFHPVDIANSSANVIRRNSFDVPEAIFLFPGATGNIVEDNVITGGCEYTYGIVLFGASDNIIRRNRISGTPCPSGGIGLCDDASRNLIEDNDIRDSMVGVNLAFDSGCGDSRGPLINNVIRRNRITDSVGDRFLPESSGDGIVVGPRTRGTVVERNTVLRNSDDGIDVQNPTTILRSNVALRNGDLGIEALGGAVDGGGNVARGNGNPAQCVGVRCS